MSTATASLLSCRVDSQSSLLLPLQKLSKLKPFRYFLQMDCLSLAVTEEDEKLCDARGPGAPLSALRFYLTSLLKSRP